MKSRNLRWQSRSAFIQIATDSLYCGRIPRPRVRLRRRSLNLSRMVLWVASSVSGSMASTVNALDWKKSTLERIIIQSLNPIHSLIPLQGPDGSLQHLGGPLVYRDLVGSTDYLYRLEQQLELVRRDAAGKEGVVDESCVSALRQQFNLAILAHSRARKQFIAEYRTELALGFGSPTPLLPDSTPVSSSRCHSDPTPIHSDQASSAASSTDSSADSQNNAPDASPGFDPLARARDDSDQPSTLERSLQEDSTPKTHLAALATEALLPGSKRKDDLFQTLEPQCSARELTKVGATASKLIASPRIWAIRSGSERIRSNSPPGSDYLEEAKIARPLSCSPPLTRYCQLTPRVTSSPLPAIEFRVPTPSSNIPTPLWSASVIDHADQLDRSVYELRGMIFQQALRQGRHAGEFVREEQIVEYIRQLLAEFLSLRRAANQYRDLLIQGDAEMVIDDERLHQRILPALAREALDLLPTPAPPAEIRLTSRMFKQAFGDPANINTHRERRRLDLPGGNLSRHDLLNRLWESASLSLLDSNLLDRNLANAEIYQTDFVGKYSSEASRRAQGKLKLGRHYLNHSYRQPEGVRSEPTTEICSETSEVTALRQFLRESRIRTLRANIKHQWWIEKQRKSMVDLQLDYQDLLRRKTLHPRRRLGI